MKSRKKATGFIPLIIKLVLTIAIIIAVGWALKKRILG